VEWPDPWAPLVCDHPGPGRLEWVREQIGETGAG